MNIFCLNDYFYISSGKWGESIYGSSDAGGLVQDCSNSIANALELLQSCT